jgi:hypothetical protein
MGQEEEDKNLGPKQVLEGRDVLRRPKQRTTPLQLDMQR